MKELFIAYPPAWTDPFTLEVSVKVSAPAALEAMADALEHGYRDRGTAETSEDYVARKAEEWLRRQFTEICRDQIAGNTMHTLQSQMTMACSIRQKKDLTLETLPASTLPDLPASTLPDLPASTLPDLPASTLPDLPAPIIPVEGQGSE